MYFLGNINVSVFNEKLKFEKGDDIYVRNLKYDVDVKNQARYTSDELTEIISAQ